MTELPSLHVMPAEGALAAFHPAVLRRPIVVPALATTLTASSVLSLVGATLYSLTPGGSALGQGGILTTALIITIVVWPILMYLLMTGCAFGRQRVAMRQFREVAETRAARVIHLADPAKADRLKKLLVNGDPRYAPIRRLTMVRIAETTRLFDEALSHMGDRDAMPARDAYRDALLRVIDESSLEVDLISARIQADQDFSAKDALQDLSFALGTSGMRPTNGTHALPDLRGDLGAMRVAAAAEKAMAIDPELTDATGNRLDTLVREHLPRLMETHADMVSTPGSDASVAKAFLDKGLALVEKSVEEAITNLQGRKADALRTEVAFLVARRGDTVLTSIPTGSETR